MDQKPNPTTAEQLALLSLKFGVSLFDAHLQLFEHVLSVAPSPGDLQKRSQLDQLQAFASELREKVSAYEKRYGQIG